MTLGDEHAKWERRKRWNTWVGRAVWFALGLGTGVMIMVVRVGWLR